MPPPMQHFGGLRRASQEARQIPARELSLLQPKLDGLDRIGRIDGMVFSFVNVHKRAEDLELVELGGSRPRAHQLLDASGRSAVVSVAANRTDGRSGRARSHGFTVSTSIRSYSACVPKNLINTRRAL